MSTGTSGHWGGMTMAPGTVLGGRYVLGPLLGRGGMADVYRATDPVLHREVAVKVLRAGPESEADRDRFADEARLLASLGHPGLVLLLDADATGPDPYLVLELVEGETWSARLGHSAAEPAEAARIGVQVAAALASAHASGVVHRDVKPANVLIDGSGRARLTDFGIARLVDDNLRRTRTGHAVGTVAYLAPEQVRGERVTPATDVYALGLVLLEAVTGRRAYPGTSAETAFARLHRSPLIPVSLPRGWPRLLAAMTAASPADRPTAAEVADRLAEILVGGELPAVAADATSATIPVVRRPRRWPLLASAAMLALLLGVAGVVRGFGAAEPVAAAPSSPRASATAAPQVSSSTTAAAVAAASARPRPRAAQPKVAQPRVAVAKAPVSRVAPRAKQGKPAKHGKPPKHGKHAKHGKPAKHGKHPRKPKHGRP